jgi:hypothetical protein
MPDQPDPPRAADRAPYTTPTLEEHPAFVTLTGESPIRVPIQLSDPFGDGE